MITKDGEMEFVRQSEAYPTVANPITSLRIIISTPMFYYVGNYRYIFCGIISIQDNKVALARLGAPSTLESLPRAMTWVQSVPKELYPKSHSGSNLSSLPSKDT